MSADCLFMFLLSLCQLVENFTIKDLSKYIQMVLLIFFFSAQT